MEILCCLGRREFKNVKFHPLPSLPTLTKYFTFYSVSAFSFYLKKKTPAKEKQTQGFAPRPRERRAAVHSLCCSVGSSAHSPVNSLLSNSTGSCGLQSKPFPRSSQLGCTTAARLLEACSPRFITSLALLFGASLPPQLPLYNHIYNFSSAVYQKPVCSGANQKI